MGKELYFSIQEKRLLSSWKEKNVDNPSLTLNLLSVESIWKFFLGIHLDVCKKL